MGIRLRGFSSQSSGNTNAEVTPSVRGFALKFTNGKTYDLDKIFQNKNMADGSSPLVIEVRNNPDMAVKVASALDKYISTKPESLKSDTQAKIIEIIQESISKYNVTDITSSFFNSFVIEDINSKVNSYLKSVYTKLDGIKFSVTIKGTERIIDISYDFENEKAYANALASIYDEYKTELEKVNLGGLAISGQKAGNIGITSTDYKKYLFDKNPCNQSTSQFTTPGERKPLIIWHEGTEDSTESSDSSVVDEVAKLSQEIATLKATLSLPKKEGTYLLEYSIAKGYEWKKLTDSTNLILSPVTAYEKNEDDDFYNLVASGLKIETAKEEGNQNGN